MPEIYKSTNYCPLIEKQEEMNIFFFYYENIAAFPDTHH